MNIFINSQNIGSLFLSVFGHTVLVQNLMYHFKRKNIERFRIFIPQEYLGKIQNYLNTIQPLCSVSIRYMVIDNESEVPLDALPANRLYYLPESFIDIKNTDDLKKYRIGVRQFILDSTQTPVARHVNKKISIPFSTILARFNISPNSITFFALVISGVGAFFLNPLGAFLCFQINSLLDGCDGEVARMNLSFSEWGRKFDVFADYLTTVLILFFVTQTFWGMSFISNAVLVGGLLCFGLLVFLWGGAVLFKKTPDNLAEIEGLCHRRLKTSQNFLDRVCRIFLFLSHRDFYIWILFLLALFQLTALIPFWMTLMCFSWLVLSVYTFGLMSKKI